MARTTHRFIRERWMITGTLELTSPAHFGSGESDSLTDMPILLNEVDNRPLLPGTSITGALRNYLRERQSGFGKPAPLAKDKNERALLATLLFGGYRGDDDGAQSTLIVHDALGILNDIELRDGVAINAETRTAADDQKFDIQLLGAGTTFDMTFELALGDPSKGKDLGTYRQRLLDGLALALNGFASGEITLGARKRRGYGQCKIEKWVVTHFDLTKSADLLAWLAYARKDWKDASVQSKQSDKIADALGIPLPDTDVRKTVTLDATFALDSTLLIRSGFGDADSGPDTVHLHSPRKGGRVPVIPGTSWAGVLRHRALKIARTVWGKDNPKCKEFVEGMFGPSEVEEKHARASRVSVAESEVTKYTSLVQTRVKIDRFTGGAYESALFTEQPLVGKPDSEVKLHLTLRVPHNKEADPRELGLLLLLLKDLWTGDLPIGGESGVGRGRLKGKDATFIIGSKPTDKWKFEEKPDGTLNITGEQGPLQKFVDAFNGKGA